MRLSLAKIIRQYKAGEIQADVYKNLVYGISQLAHVFRTETELEQDKRIEEIEKMLQEIAGGKS